MNALFRVDASLEMGTGHVMRCITLAETLRQNGVEVEFISREHQGNEIKKIEDIFHGKSVAKSINIPIPND